MPLYYVERTELIKNRVIIAAGSPELAAEAVRNMPDKGDLIDHYCSQLQVFRSDEQDQPVLYEPVYEWKFSR